MRKVSSKKAEVKDLLLSVKLLGGILVENIQTGSYNLFCFLGSIF